MPMASLVSPQAFVDGGRQFAITHARFRIEGLYLCKDRPAEIRWVDQGLSVPESWLPRAGAVSSKQST